jgi:hypothetical protein
MLCGFVSWGRREDPGATGVISCMYVCMYPRSLPRSTRALGSLHPCLCTHLPTHATTRTFNIFNIHLFPAIGYPSVSFIDADPPPTHYLTLMLVQKVSSGVYFGSGDGLPHRSQMTTLNVSATGSQIILTSVYRIRRASSLWACSCVRDVTRCGRHPVKYDNRI